MFIGILFTVLVSLAIGTFSLLTFTGFWRVKERFSSMHVYCFCLFWLGMSVVWFLTATTDLFGYMGKRWIAIGITYVLQVFVGASLVVIAHYLNSVVSKGRLRRTAIVIYGFLYILFLCALFWFRVKPQTENFFTNQVTSPPEALVIFMIMFVPLWVAALWLFIRTVLHKTTLVPDVYYHYFFVSLSLLMLGIAGSIDELGFVKGALVTSSRLVSLVAAIFARLAVSALHESDELVV